MAIYARPIVASGVSLKKPGSHQSSRFNSVSNSLTHIGSIASHDAKKRKKGRNSTPAKINCLKIMLPMFEGCFLIK